MPIKNLTPAEEIAERLFEEAAERARKVALRNLAYIGEQCVNKARQSTGYKDQTGNLRSSVGYVIVLNGEVVSDGGFQAADGGTDRRTGQGEGRAYARSLAAEYPRDTAALVVVAGMRYAAYVAAKGRDVLDGAELLADRLCGELLKN